MFLVALFVGFGMRFSARHLTPGSRMFLVALFVGVGTILQARARKSGGATGKHRGDAVTTAALGFYAGGLVANVVAFPMDAASALSGSTGR